MTRSLLWGARAASYAMACAWVSGCMLDTGSEETDGYEAYVTSGSGSGSGGNCTTSCDDGNPCTDDSCVNGTCVHTNNTRSCTDDGNVCTSDVCSGGACTHPAKAAGTTCTSDNNECTNDVCSGGSCTHPPKPDGSACTKDANSCTEDMCRMGACTHPPKPDDSTCDDEPNSATSDLCCAVMCKHRMTTMVNVTRTATLLDPQNQRAPNPPCPIGRLTATLTGPGGGARASGATYTLTVSIAATHPGEPDMPAYCNDLDCPGIMEAIAPLLGGSWNPATQTLTITKMATATCGGGTLDLSINYPSSDPRMAGNSFAVPASVSLSTSCCRIDSASGTIGTISFVGPDGRSAIR